MDGNQTAADLAKRIEDDTNPADHSRAKDGQSAADGVAAAFEAADKGVNDQVSDQLRKDGFEEPAQLVDAAADAFAAGGDNDDQAGDDANDDITA